MVGGAHRNETPFQTEYENVPQPNDWEGELRHPSGRLFIISDALYDADQKKIEELCAQYKLPGGDNQIAREVLKGLFNELIEAHHSVYDRGLYVYYSEKDGRVAGREITDWHRLIQKDRLEIVERCNNIMAVVEGKFMENCERLEGVERGEDGGFIDTGKNHLVLAITRRKHDLGNLAHSTMPNMAFRQQWLSAIDNPNVMDRMKKNRARAVCIYISIYQNNGSCSQRERRVRKIRRKGSRSRTVLRGLERSSGQWGNPCGPEQREQREEERRGPERRRHRNSGDRRTSLGDNRKRTLRRTADGGNSKTNRWQRSRTG